MNEEGLVRINPEQLKDIFGRVLDESLQQPIAHERIYQIMMETLEGGAA